jgi:hypothetical protein
MKYSEKGGSDVIDPAHKLNMWVCNLGSGLLGYAQFPGGNSKQTALCVVIFALAAPVIWKGGLTGDGLLHMKWVIG